MNADVFVIVADENVQISPLVRRTQTFGGTVHALVVGSREQADAVARFDVEDVTWIEPAPDACAEAYMQTAAALIAEAQPRTVLAAEASASRAIAGATAAKLGSAIASGLVGGVLRNDALEIECSIAEDRALERFTIAAGAGPVVALVADGGDDAEEAASAAPVRAVDAQPTAMQVLGTNAQEGAAGLAEAERVVGVGRGFLEKDRLVIAEELCDALGAEMACSLSLCDDYRWFEHNRVVGTSTQRISPRLYIACGISGQPQHLAGVRAAKTIVAINRDPDAPIFRSCDYGIVGDLNEVVPALTKALA